MVPTGWLENYFTMKLIKHWNKGPGPEPGGSVFGDLIEQSCKPSSLNLVFDPSLSSPSNVAGLLGELLPHCCHFSTLNQLVLM